jgi:hypothetical protein
MNTEELGFRSSLLTGDPQSRLGKTDTRGLSRLRDGGDQCRRGDAEAGNGISGLLFVP